MHSLLATLREQRSGWPPGGVVVAAASSDPGCLLVSAGALELEVAAAGIALCFREDAAGTRSKVAACTACAACTDSGQGQGLSAASLVLALRDGWVG